MRQRVKSVFRVLAVVTAFSGLLSTSWAASLSATLQGSWSGSGRITLTNGKSERIRCHGSGRQVTQNSIEQQFHCASTEKEFDFSTSIQFSGSTARGHWSAPDKSGTLSGQASTSHMQLHLSSASGSGTLSATIGACSQSLTVTGWSNKLKSLSVNLKKDC